MLAAALRNQPGAYAVATPCEGQCVRRCARREWPTAALMAALAIATAAGREAYAFALGHIISLLPLVAVAGPRERRRASLTSEQHRTLRTPGPLLRAASGVSAQGSGRGS